MRNTIVLVALGGVLLGAAISERPVQVISDADQQAIELTAAHYISRPDTSLLGDRTGLLLDPRVYVVPFVYPRTEPRREPASSIPASHSGKHLAEVAASFGVAGVIEDSQDCRPQLINDPCRRRGSRGTVAFGPATAKGTSGSVIVFRAIFLTNSRSQSTLTAWHFNLTRVNGGWRVDSVRTSSAS
jgi:hypothetical protein